MQSSIMEDTHVNEAAQPQSNSAAFSYDALFPALPANAAAPSLGNAPATMRVGSSVVTQIFHVPCEERKSSDSEKFGEGESLRCCQQIMKETGAHIEIASGKDQSLTFLVQGKQSEVLDARRKILVHFQTQANKQVSIPKEHHRLILGKKGDRLRELERVTATKINVPNINEESDTISISGTKEGIEKAEHEIRTMSDEQLKKSYESVPIPKIYHPFICGPFHENVNKLMELTGVKINVPPQSVMKDDIIITGEKDGVMAAKHKIEEIYHEMEEKCSTVSVEVAKAQHRYVIGVRGSTIQEILQLTGVSVEMPPSDSPIDTITLRGPQIAMSKALSVVYAKANSVKTVEIKAPNWIHKYVIGRKGANMKEFENEYPNVNVNCLDNTIKLEGEPEMVERAVAYLEGIVNNYETNFSCDVMTVNPNHYKHIIGKAGANVNRLKEELKVIINIEERDGANNIRIEGPKEGVAQAKLELREQIDKLENEKAKDVNINRRLHRAIIGTKGEKIRELKDRYRQVNIFVPGQNENTDIVKLRGPKEDVDKCYKDLMKLVKEIQESSHVIEVPIFKQLHRFIIGKGGANIKKIRDETQTVIELPNESDKNEVIIITGKKANALEAKERIQKIQNELADIVTEEIQIAPKHYNSIIGTGGKLISAIMEECGGVSINIPSSDSKSDKVEIRGPKDDVEKAKAQLLELVSECELTSFTAEVRAKQQHHKFIIGKNGASLRKIRDSTGARIIFPNNDDEDKEIITIIGKEKNVKAAKEQLENIIRDIDLETEVEITVDPKYHKHFVARRGKILHRISDENGGVSISFPRTGVESDKVTLKGAKDCIESAKQRIQEIVDDLEAQVTIEVVIPQKHHRSIMGSRGAKIQVVTSDYDVQIKFPDRDAVEPVDNVEPADSAEPVEELVNGDEEVIRQCDIIRIIGRAEKCEAAKQALLNLVPVSEMINVPNYLHRSIIGQKGANIRVFTNQYDVYIELSSSMSKSDWIKITGAAENVAEAKQALLKQVEEFEAEHKDRQLRAFELTLDIDPEHHPKIIGRRGAVVNKLRADHDVKIVLPKGPESSITLTGYEANVNACKEEILNMISEFNDMYKEVIDVDNRVHARLIGQRGRNIRKIMDDYKVEIKLPKQGDENINGITIIGDEKNVENAKDHILNLEEEYLQDITTEPVPSHTTDISSVIQEAFYSHNNTNTQRTGFVLQGAPWERREGGGGGGNKNRGGNSNGRSSAPNTQSQEDFPDFGKPANNGSGSMSSAWGPRR